MKNLQKIGTVAMVGLIFLLGASGCSGDKIMRDRFGDNQTAIMTDDATGNKYVVKHHIGDTYSGCRSYCSYRK